MTLNPQILADAIYLEIISFTPSTYPPNSPERRKWEKHPWAKRAPGWIAYAFLGNGSLTLDERISAFINHRAEREGSTVRYLAEESGGRTRQDGVHLEWLISTPQDQEWGILPFFCGDVTPRDLRVPRNHMEHPSGAAGIAYVKVLADESSLQASAKQLTTVIGSVPKQISETRIVWDLLSPNSRVTKLILAAPSDDEETLFVEETGAGAIYEIGIAAAHREGTVKTPYGRLAWIRSEMPAVNAVTRVP
ncbi:hypothetical protein APHAL10511_007119 [Amanita phalloides]|nr:hypothetical protein APHAL10511_007119 [Amanita phalloides]